MLDRLLGIQSAFLFFCLPASLSVYLLGSQATVNQTVRLSVCRRFAELRSQRNILHGDMLKTWRNFRQASTNL